MFSDVQESNRRDRACECRDFSGLCANIIEYVFYDVAQWEKVIS